ncbi:MAG: VOC family protein, partial [Solirubrobacteraceae bacterium]
MARGFIRGTHHLTFCVGGAQEDYDFHVRLLGLKSVKKTVLFDGEIPVYHLYYGNGLGDTSTLLTAFPYRQAGWMGKRGTNQAKSLNLAVPADSVGFWADRLSEHGVEHERGERFGTERLYFRHPCGIEYTIVGEGEPDSREPYEGPGVPAQHAIRGAYGTTTSVREPDPMSFFVTKGMGGELLSSEGAHHQFQIGDEQGHGRMLELVEEPDLPQGTWNFGEGTIHHHAFDVVTASNQQVVKDWLVGLGFTDVSEAKDRGYFFSMYCRSPSG